MIHGSRLIDGHTIIMPWNSVDRSTRSRRWTHNKVIHELDNWLLETVFWTRNHRLIVNTFLEVQTNRQAQDERDSDGTYMSAHRSISLSYLSYDHQVQTIENDHWSVDNLKIIRMWITRALTYNFEMKEVDEK